VVTTTPVIVRASTITEAEQKITEEEWSALILDISMDITASIAGPRLGGHATLGGLGIATKMFLLDREVPTIIVTAFDTFQDTVTEAAEYEVLGLEQIERRAREILGSALIGCVRYGSASWEAELSSHIRGLFK
jgi:hypothetical protein